MKQNNPRTDKIAPHSQEAEESVLGSILINPDCLEDVASFLVPADFFIVKNAWLFEAIIAIWKRKEAIDVLTVSEELRSKGRLDQIGGPAYIVKVSNDVPTHIHAETYAHIVERASVRRKLLGAASEIAQISLEENAEIEDVIANCSKILAKAIDRSSTEELSSIMTEILKLGIWIEDRTKNPDSDITLPTGFVELDKILGGLHNDDLCVIAARPSTGKSAWLANVAVNLSIKNGKRVAFFSLETDKERLRNRIVGSIALIDTRILMNGVLTEQEWDRYWKFYPLYEKLNIFIDDTPRLKLASLRTKVRKLIRSVGHVDVIMVDYLQLMRSGEQHTDRHVEVSAIAAGLKAIAKEFHVPVVAAAQLNRISESRGDKRPQLHDLKESGGIEEAADQVIMLYKEENQHSKLKEVEFLVRKNRDGNKGVAKLLFDAPYTLFVNKQDEPKESAQQPLDLGMNGHKKETA